MRSIQVTALDGPAGVSVQEVPDITAHDGHVLVEVKALGVSWPDLLQTKGQYQLKPELPFQLGVDFAGVVREAPDGSGFAAGQRVAGCLPYGGGADLVSLDPESVFALPDNLSFEQGAAIPMNYLTAEFALATRGALEAGQTLLVTGAAGGVGTATIQVGKGLGARVIALVSTEEKAAFAKQAGADEAVLSESFLPVVRELTGGAGVDVALDVVGEPLVTDLLRSLGPLGRLLVVGFTGGTIPQVATNRLLLNNVDVRGVGWGAFAMFRPGYMRGQWQRLLPMMESGVIDPPIGKVYELDQVRDALVEMDERRTLGKSIVRF
ncbi:NADPH:quinone oxidoreductase family protein [Nocardioides pelophilus]|uniref:NADPH:quinone oxidoreductase family protein n=1 Tax=Nocardioides pelophilus TaxID=2172019 RepID=UPI001603D5AA|nr:NADPH:quinone oxidoreductase family protein [Nocardioides pelophilus]